MGFRLDIKSIKNDQITDLFYGTKLVGYVDNDLLQSIQYLKSIKKEYPVVAYDYTEIILDVGQFHTFITYYEFDMNKFNDISLQEIDAFDVVLNALDDDNIIGYIVGWC